MGGGSSLIIFTFKFWHTDVTKTRIGLPESFIVVILQRISEKNSIHAEQEDN
jgi:hypothetical protein